MVTIEPSRRDRKKDETRQRIVASAIQIFAAKGIDGATVDDIATAADVGKGTIYNYFRTKEDIVVAFLVEIERQVQAKVVRRIKRPRSLRSALADYMLFQFTLKRTHHEFVRVLLAYMVTKASTASPWIQQLQTVIDPPLRALLTSLQRRRLIRSDVDVTALVQTFKVTHLGLTALWAMEGPPWSATRAAVNAQIQLICEGLEAR